MRVYIGPLYTYINLVVFKCLIHNIIFGSQKVGVLTHIFFLLSYLMFFSVETPTNVLHKNCKYISLLIRPFIINCELPGQKFGIEHHDITKRMDS